MKQGWTYKKLGEVCEALNGLWKGKKPPYVNVGVIRNANFTKDFTLRYDNIEYLDVEERQYIKRKLQKGDLIIEKSGGSEKQPVGRAVLFDKDDGEFSFSNFTSVLRIKEKDKFLSRFLYIYLLYIYKRGDTAKMQKATTGIHNIEFEKYLDINIPNIDKFEQQRIVERLDAAFAHIDQLKANAEKQLNDARALFQKALAKAMEPKEGWEENMINDFCNVTDFVANGSFATLRENVKYYDEPNYAILVRLADFSSNFDSSKFVYVDKHAYDFLSKSSLEVGDIIMSNVGSIGKCFMCPDLGRPMTVGPNSVLVKTPYNKFFLYYFRSDSFQKKLKLITSQSTLAKFNKTQLRNMCVCYPPLQEQQRIVSRLDSLSENIKKLEENQKKIIAECDALKQALLRKVFE